MQQVMPVGIVQRRGHLADDAHRAVRWHAFVVFGERLFGVGAVDEAHADPELTALRSAIVHGHDVRVVQLRDGVRFPLEPPDERGVVAQLGPQQFERIMAREPGVTDEIDRAHPAGPEFALDGVAGEDLTRLQRHARHCASTALGNGDAERVRSTDRGAPDLRDPLGWSMHAHRRLPDHFRAACRFAGECPPKRTNVPPAGFVYMISESKEALKLSLIS